MPQKLVIIGAGFAGMYAALSTARLRDASHASNRELEIVLVPSEPTLLVRPRLYEPNPETLTAPLGDVLRAIDVGYIQGTVEIIDKCGRSIALMSSQHATRLGALAKNNAAAELLGLPTPSVSQRQRPPIRNASPTCRICPSCHVRSDPPRPYP